MYKDSDLRSVGCLVAVGGRDDNGRVVSKLNDGVGAVLTSVLCRTDVVT